MDECRTLERIEESIIPPGYEGIVDQSQYDLIEETWREWNTRLRDFLRAETGFKLAVDGKQKNIQISVNNYIDPRLDYFIKLQRMENWVLGQKRPLLEYLLQGATDLNRYFESNPKGLEKFPLTSAHRTSLEQYPEAIQKILDNLPNWQIEFRRLFTDVDEDILGCYFIETNKVQLNWIPIAIYAEAAGLSIEDLTVVVLLHELAHAYTHVGMDIDGHSWETKAFSKTDLRVLEGLAQYYTSAYLSRKLDDTSGPYKAFETLLGDQPIPYHAHLRWIDKGQSHQGEVIRLSLLQARSQEYRVSYDEFCNMVAFNKDAFGQ
jgi:hypothetical protein